MLIKFKRIDDLRIDNDLKAKEIADILGISLDNYFDYANERSNFLLNKLNKLGNYFKVSFDYITGLSGVKAYLQGDIDLNYESGHSVIPVPTLYLLVKYYYISIDYFVEKTDTKKEKSY